MTQRSSLRAIAHNLLSSIYNHAGCEDPLCQRCEDYPAGYVDGKSKALFEVSMQTTDHAANCWAGCDRMRDLGRSLRSWQTPGRGRQPEGERRSDGLSRLAMASASIRYGWFMTRVHVNRCAGARQWDKLEAW